MNSTKNTAKFKGEIETYLRKRHNHLDLTIGVSKKGVLSYFFYP